MRRFLPSLSALQAFEAAARHQSFTKAGEELGMTQSGISRQIQNLETFLGIRLFERIGSRLTLTGLGNKYFLEITQNLNRLEEVSMDAVRGRTADASLMIGAAPTLETRWLLPRLGSFLSEHPDIPVEITTLGAEPDFRNDGIDIAIMRGFGTWPDARAKPLFDEELVVVASPKIVPPGSPQEPLDFARYPILQNASRPSLWLIWLRVSKLNYSGRIQGVRLSTSELLIQAAVNGIGLAVVPPQFVKREIERGELHTPFGPPVRSGEGYWVVQSERESQHENAAAFRNWLLREAVRERNACTARPPA
ncbi:LysR substrate-binding domain-containing protein [Rhizobiaceae bacterium BDR2-2]|uniref:LysR substrate-binding domain-containing protein n=1 Tax=Ectorhizobium quercum TaxID=2965071 RepID=A0AAE3MXZ1_9HYPH|nr:LysR substrate-binding domain-containing protein [Ectorhizobium quercum]MCX8995522.1 LysR substrate-binding domain-containing protein [Ectorhizobium quercum]